MVTIVNQNEVADKLNKACVDVAKRCGSDTQDVDVAAFQIGRALGAVSKKIVKRSVSNVDNRADELTRKVMRITQHSGVTLVGVPKYPAQATQFGSVGAQFPIPKKGASARDASGNFQVRRTPANRAPRSFHYNAAAFAKLGAAVEQKRTAVVSKHKEQKKILDDMRGRAAKTFAVAAAKLHPQAVVGWNGPDWINKKSLKHNFEAEVAGTRIEMTEGSSTIYVIAGNKVADRQGADKIFISAIEGRLKNLETSIARSKVEQLRKVAATWGGVVNEL